MKTLSLPATVLTLATFGAAVAVPPARSAEPSSAADVALFERLDANGDGQLAPDEVSAANQRLFARLLRHADVNKSGSLSREEFMAGMVPTRPEKPLEEKTPSTLPEADAVRFLLLSMDTNGNASIDQKEVPGRFQPVFESIVRRIDNDKNNILDRRELYRAAPQLAQIAGRYVRQQGIDASSELKKLEEKIGQAAANRFEEPPPRFERLGNPEQARRLFAQLDADGNGQIEKKEATGPLEAPVERLLRATDRDGDGQLSESEFLAGARQLGRRRGRDDRPRREGAEPKPLEAMPAEKAMPAEDAMSAESK
jgi:Ca2+-binding EF-hand superfamily protein